MPRGCLDVLRCESAVWHLRVRMWLGVMLGDLRDVSDYCSHLQPQVARSCRSHNACPRFLFPRPVSTVKSCRRQETLRHFHYSSLIPRSSRRHTKSRSSPRPSTKSLPSKCNFSSLKGTRKWKISTPEMSKSSSGPGDRARSVLSIGTAYASTRCLHARINSTERCDWGGVLPTSWDILTLVLGMEGCGGGAAK